MTLEYTPELIDYRLKSYHRDGKHIIRGHLIGTKTADRGWSVDKETIGEHVKTFMGNDWIVSPKQFDPIEHFLIGTSYEDQVKQQKAVTKGTIMNILGPFSYNDGSNDIYYDFEADVTDKPVSEALLEGRLPFQNSPYIWPLKEDNTPYTLAEIQAMKPEQRIGVKRWKGVHSALVTTSAFGPDAHISKQCLGPEKICTQALAGSSVDVAKILSSQIHSEKLNKGNTMENQNTPDVSGIEQVSIPEAKDVTNNAPIKTPEVKAPEVIVPKEDNARLTALEAELEKEKKNSQKLLTLHKKSELTKIFGESKDENVTKIINKWAKAEVFDFDSLIEIISDLNSIKGTDKNPLVGSSITQDVTVFPANNQPVTRVNRLNRERSATELLGGAIIK